MKLIGLGCTAQVGKDTAAEYWEAKFPGEVKRVAFADKVKRTAMLVFDLSYEQCFGPKEIKEAVDPRWGKSPREIMQGIGDKMRQIHPMVWIDTVFYSTIPDLETEGFDTFVVSDVRYPNEGDKILDEGGFVIKVEREEGEVLVGADHPSETAMKDYKRFTAVVENNGTFDEYFKKLDAVMEKINGQTDREERGNND